MDHRTDNNGIIMKIKRLDRRFKLKKAGLADWKITIPYNHFVQDGLHQRLEEMYGIGKFMHDTTSVPYIRNRYDWFYMYSRPSKKLLSVDIFFKREDQVIWTQLL